MYTLKTYEDLRRYCRHFAQGNWTCLIVVGGPGLGKSRTMADALPKIRTPEDVGARWIESHVSAFQLYRELHSYLDRTFVLDDVDHLCRDPGIVKLLKGLCNTEKSRRIYWATSNRDLEKEGIPREFDSKSKVALIINKWETVDENVGALEDRGMVIKFAPSSFEVHRQVGTWFRDKRVYGYVEERLDRIFQPSQRLYLTASSLKGFGEDWKGWIEEKIALPDEVQVVRELRADPNYTSEHQRLQRYTAVTGKGRASYFRTVSELKAVEQANSGVAHKPKCPPRKRMVHSESPGVELSQRCAAKQVKGESKNSVSGREKATVATEDFAIDRSGPLFSVAPQGLEVIPLPMTSQEALSDFEVAMTNTASSLPKAS